MTYFPDAQLRYRSTEHGRAKRREANRAFRSRNLEKRRAETRQWRQKYPLRGLLCNARGRARRKGIAFELKESDFLPLPTHCPVLGVELIWGGPQQCPHSPSIDRFDLSKGYTPDNSRIISFRANHLKLDGTIPELEAVLRYMKGEV